MFCLVKCLEISDVRVSVNGIEVVKGVTLKIKPGEIHALMGPNGSGKTSLSYAVMGHPRYEITSGDVFLNGESIIGMSVDDRARKGLFLGFQYPIEVPGVGLGAFLRTAMRFKSGNAKQGEQLLVNPLEFNKRLYEKMDLLEMDQSFSKRYLNEGFSGGEKKRSEILQMAVLEPEYAILDEPDSGLDIDGLKAVSRSIRSLSGPNLGLLLVTHYERILSQVSPTFVHVMINGEIVKSGGVDLARELESKGYDWLRK